MSVSRRGSNSMAFDQRLMISVAAEGSTREPDGLTSSVSRLCFCVCEWTSQRRISWSRRARSVANCASSPPRMHIERMMKAQFQPRETLRVSSASP